MSQDQYRHYAAECLLLAEEMRNSVHRSILLAMSDAWIALAERAAASARVTLGTRAAPEGEEPA